ncbi:MAG: glycosyltransferase family 1 protein [Pseudomonadota bacterium]
MRLLIVSDAWYPQVNGVVRTLDTTAQHLRGEGHEVEVIGPDRFRTVPLPTYREIQLAVQPKRLLQSLVDDFKPEAVHIATEGPLGWAMRSICRRRNWPFTTSFHTQFPEYVWLRTRLPLSWTYGLMLRFHRAAARTMVATPTLENRLRARGFQSLVRWTRGVDTDLFHPRDKDFLDLPRPVSMFVGRVAVEKNLDDFLRLKLPGSKVVVGGGPQLDGFVKRYPEVRFVGPKKGEELASYYAAGDVFVFPSRTDTFGLVMLEALASGVPVAAYPVQGPLDVIDGTGVGCLSEDLAAAVDCALRLPPEACRAFALERSWPSATQQFLGNLAPFG